MRELPDSSKIIVIGGGIVGCSTACHLAKLGCETLLLEQHKLTSGTTFHAAGLVGQLRSNSNVTRLLGYSVELYKNLQRETGQATGWKMNGGLRLACNADRWTEVKRQATTARSFGLDMHLLTPEEAKTLWPLMAVDDVIGAAYLPTDGQANPSDITQALAKAAKQSGALVFEDTGVLDIEIGKNGIAAVITNRGRIECEKVVCCAGQWTRAFAARFGVNVPLVSVQHQYMLTDRIAGVDSSLPTLRDPDRLTYYKEEVGGLVMGGYESNPRPWAIDGIPEHFSYTLLDSNFDHFEPMLELAVGRVPALAEAGIKQLTNGPESFTPDGNFILGEAPERRNFFVGAGFNAFGIAAAGGAGMALAEWVSKGVPPFDLWSVDIRRFGRPHMDTDWVRTRTLEAYSKHYTLAWPHEEHSSGRPCRRSPLFAQLKKAGACFGEKLGWERPNWFADLKAGEIPRDVYSFDKPGWHDAVGREHRAVRNAAVLIDQTSFAKFILKGPDALEALNWIAANDVSKPPGTITYTQMLDDNGGIQADVTVTRLSVNEFYIVTGTGFATRDFNWISSNIAPGLNAQLVDVTSSNCVLSLMGPLAREILQSVTRSNVSNEAFPFATMQTIGIGGCPVHALRITYVGELGWELHLPVEYAVTVYDALIAAGVPAGMINAGYRVIESCRLEKGYRAWGSDIGPDHTPLEAGLGWAVKANKSEIPFKGRDAILQQWQTGLKKKLVGFSVTDPDVSLSGQETIFRNGEHAGWLGSGGFGHHLGCSIGYGYIRQHDGVDDDYINQGDYEIEVATKRVPCDVHLVPLYDAEMQRVRS